jgi:hypothetical protein
LLRHVCGNGLGYLEEFEVFLEDAGDHHNHVSIYVRLLGCCEQKSRDAIVEGTKHAPVSRETEWLPMSTQ